MEGSVFLLLLSLVGLCSALLQPGLEYHYRYNGRVASGVVDIKHQFAAAGIRADVVVQMEDHYSAIVQFSNVEVGDFHDEFTCDMDAPLSMEYHHLVTGVEFLERPFRVAANGTKVIEYMEVPIEPVWITNIRKAVVNIFRILPFGVEEDHTSHHPDFSAQEDTIYGHCTNWYNVLKLSDVDADRENHHREQVMEVDVQRESGQSSGQKTSAKGHAKGHRSKTSKSRKSSKSSKTSRTSKTSSASKYSVPPLEETLWNVVHTVDFDACDYLVTMENHVHHPTEELFSRSSMGTYVIRGNAEYARIEHAVIEGSITLFTQVDHKEHFDTFTNQTLELKSVHGITDPLTIDFDTHRTHNWHYELDHSIVDETIDGVHPSLEQILTGVELTEHHITEIKRVVKEGIQELSARIPRNPTHRQDLVTEIDHVVDAFSLLSYQHVQQIYDEFVNELQEKEIYILKQVMIATGTEPAIFFLLDKMKDPAFRHEDDETVYNFFSQIPNTAKSPRYITKIMEVVTQLTWSDQEQHSKSVALITFSQLVHEMCLMDDRRTSSRDTTCLTDHQCDPEPILNVYFPYLQHGLEDDESPLWRRFLYLQALNSLGSPQALHLLQPYVLGTQETNLAFRKTAIWALRSSNMPQTATSSIFAMLMPIFENVVEHHEVRSMAFLVMATWETNLSWWHRMARSTWHDHSQKVASFISTTIKSTAHLPGGGKLAECASRVEHLVKPFSPASVSHSMGYYLLEDYYAEKVGSRLSFAWLANTESLVPAHVYLRLKIATFIGFTHDLTVSIHQFGGDEVILPILERLLVKHNPVDQVAIDIVRGMFNKMKEVIGLVVPENEENALLIKVQEVFQLIMSTDDGLTIYDYLNHRPRFFNLPHYNRYSEAYVAFPTSLGLPFVAKHTAEYAWWFELILTSSTPLKGIAKATLDASNRISVETKMLLPWSEKFAIGSGVDHEMSVLLPFNIHYTVAPLRHELHFTIEPLTNDAVHMVEAHNCPHTVQYGAFPTPVHFQNHIYKEITQTAHYIYDRHAQVLPSVVGLWVESQWTGDIPFPFSLIGLYKGEFDLFTPSLSAWSYHLEYDPQRSTTKSISTTVTYVYTGKSSRIVQDPQELEPLGQVSQGAADYADFSQSSSSDYSQFDQSSSSDYQEFGDVIVEQESATRQRIAKLQEQVIPASGGHVQSVSFDFKLQGSPNRKYETLFTWSHGMVSAKKSSKFQFTFIDDVPEGALGQPHATCLNMQVLKPSFVPFSSAEQILAHDFGATIKIDIHDGTNCDDAPILELEGMLDVSPEQMNEARRKLNDDHCGSHSDYHPVDMLTSPIYDHTHYKVHWTEDFPIELQNFTYFVYDMVRGDIFPNFDYTVQNQDRTIDIDARKDMHSHEWTAHTTKPSEVSIAEHFHTPYLLDLFMTPIGIRNTLIFDALNGRDHQACVVSLDKVRTFDGLEYSYQPDDCWNVLNTDVAGTDTGSVEVRYHDGRFECRLLYTDEGLLFEMTKDSLKVNGEDFQGHDDRFKIDYVDDGAVLTLYLVSHENLKITDTAVYYLEDKQFVSKVDGLCGNFDGEIYNEMVGPKGCVYTDPELYAKAWSMEGQGCSGFSYLAKMRPVKAFQDACHHRTSTPTGVSHPEVIDQCTDWEYQEMNIDGYHCKSLVPTPKCKPGCLANRLTSPAPMKYDCRLIEQQSVEHSFECHVHEYATQYPVNCEHE